MNYDQWKRRPCYRVHCFAQLCLRLTATYKLNANNHTWKSRTPFAQAFHSVRCLPAYRGIGGNTLRKELAATLKNLRAAGLTYLDVRRYADLMIDAPISIAGKADKAIRAGIESDLIALLTRKN